jgi:hypothetical protein
MLIQLTLLYVRSPIKLKRNYANKYSLYRCLRTCLTKRTSTERGTRGGALGSGTALQAGMTRVRFLIVSLEFFIDIMLPAALWPWGRLSL